MGTEEKPEHFLRLVANAFYKEYRNSLHKICFVFPNRRSGTFFMKELSSIASQPILSPKITTITDFLADITGCVEISKIESLFVLYSIYKDLKSSPDDFDKFSYWGDIILNDFNDVDKYLTDPKRIFKNIKDFKEISSNFLTQEQIDVISEFFGKNWQPTANDEDNFWKDPKIYGKKSEEFADIWDILHELYQRFNQKLDELGLSYSGKIYRKAAEQICDMGKDDFRYAKYVFVGFNVLSISEIKIFKELGKKGLADYYWDCNSPALSDIKNKATLFLYRNRQMFKSQLELHEQAIDSFGKISVIGTPSNIGQVKYISKIIDKLCNEQAISDRNNAINTAIVLPDESLFIPLLDSIPNDINNVNITMGYPLRLSAISTIMAMIAKMLKQAQKVKVKGEEKEIAFFKEDVCDVLSHPFVKIIAPEDAAKINEYIYRNNMFFIPVSKLNELAPELCHIFMPLNDTKSAKCLVEYILSLLKFIEGNLLKSDKISHNSVEFGFISQYTELLNQLISIVRKYEFDMNVNTFFFLISRVLSSASIAFEGEPMRGLQIMGILETRCLDFDNIIILSMNERVFPRKHYSRSFIPNSMRRAFHMATVEYQDCMYAYYFYRMISRAKNVYLLYDARTQAMGSGEPSRYIEQLRVLYPQANISHDIINFNISVPQKIEICVQKDERVMELLNRYRTPDSGCYLSASSINQYINCPLSFYLERVENLHIEDEATEFMDSSTIGTIVHSVMKQIYDRIKGQNGIITSSSINAILNDDKYLSSVIVSTINKEYHKIIGYDDTSLTGETQIVKEAIISYIQNILRYDSQLGNISFVMAEEKEELSWKVGKDNNDVDLCINIKQFIDRVDKINIDGKPTLRIVDYKTGKDKTSANNMEQLFDPKTYDGRRKALLQLMLYCNVYASDKGYTEAIKPVIYSIKKMQDSGFIFCKKDINDYRDINSDFIDHLREKLTKMFNSGEPFTQTENEDYCKYCKFSAFCHR